MVDRTDARKDIVPAQSAKMYLLASGTTWNSGSDTMTLNLSGAGISTVLGVMGYIHTTENSIIVQDSGATTAVASDTLTYTSTAVSSGAKRVVIVFGE